MCKPSCCPGKSSNGLEALLVLAGIIVIASIAVPVIQAADAFLRAVITAAVIAGTAIGVVAILIAAIMVVRHFSATRQAQPGPRQISRSLAVAPVVSPHLVAVPTRRLAIEAGPNASVSQIHQQRVLRHLQSCPHCLQATARQLPPGHHLGGGSDAW